MTNQTAPREIANLSKVSDLMSVKAGDVFTFSGYEYRAETDATVFNGSIRIAASRREIGSTAHYTLADILEWMKPETAPRRAFVSVQDFGDETQCRELCELINAATFYHAYVGHNGNPVIPCQISELGDFLSRMAQNEKTSWIEFSVQFEF